MKNFRKFPNLVLAVALLTAATAADAHEKRQISIGPSSTSIPVSGVRIAKELGLFDKHDIDAKVIALDNASVATTGLLSGSLDFAVINPTDVVITRSRGQNLVAVMSLYTEFPAVLVLSKTVADRLGVAADAPVPKRLQALNGLVIATPSATSSYTISLKSAAEAAGAKISFVYMAQPAMLAALEAGAIHGFVGSSPFYGVPVIAGKGVAWINGPQGEYPEKYALSNSIALITKEDFASRNRELVQDVVKVFEDLAAAIDQRPDEVKSAVARLFPDVDAKTLDVILKTEMTSFKARRFTTEHMTRAIDFLRLSGVALPNDLDPAAMVLR